MMELDISISASLASRSRYGYEELRLVSRSLVSLVDDDESIRESLPELLNEFGFDVQAFASAEEFLASDVLGRTDCLVLDITMPGMSGPSLQNELSRQGRAIPIVFITANAEESLCAQLVAAGAVDCLAKPFSDTALFSAVTRAIREK